MVSKIDMFSIRAEHRAQSGGNLCEQHFGADGGFFRTVYLKQWRFPLPVKAKKKNLAFF